MWWKYRRGIPRQAGHDRVVKWQRKLFARKRARLVRALSLAIARAHAGRNWAGNINYFLFDRIYWNITVCINCNILKINYTVCCNFLSNKKRAYPKYGYAQSFIVLFCFNNQPLFIMTKSLPGLLPIRYPSR